MKASDAVKLLKNNSVFWSKLGFFHDPPRFDEDGQMIVFGNDFERFGRFHQDFTAAGVKIHTSIVFSGWTGIGQYDYTLTDQVLDTVFKDNPDIWFIPRVKLNVPLDWGKQNPEDICVYYEGPREKEDIRKLINTDKHDILGYESPIGYYTAGAWDDNRPNVGGLISNQSFSSEKWLHDAGETLRRFIQHLENGSYGKRILAYHIAYGVSGETCLWGRFGEPVKFGDYGINNRKSFFDWGIKQYGSLENLRLAWGNDQLDRDNCEPPCPELRETTSRKSADFLRQLPKYKICVDYDRFTSDINVKAVEHFCRIVKEVSKGKAAGCFYGYIMEVARSAYTGYLGFDKLLSSPYVDFVAAPKSYYRNSPGEPGGLLAPAQSINRKKIWLDEIDNRTHLCNTSESSCRTFEDTQCVLWREFSKNMANGSGMWWMDLGGGWFDSPEILKEISRIEEVKEKLNRQEGHGISQILLVVDEKSFLYSSVNNDLHRILMQDFVREMQLCGAPVDIYRLSDLTEINLDSYKLICFLNCFKLPLENWSRILPRINKQTTLLWNYYLGNSQEITGFKLYEHEDGSGGDLIFNDDSRIEYKTMQFPLFEIKADKDHEVKAVYSDNRIAIAQNIFNERKNIFCTMPILKSRYLRQIVESAGCHLFAPAGCTVYADSRFIGVFPANDINANLSLMSPEDLMDCETGKGFSKSDRIILDVKAGRYKFFMVYS